MYEQTSMIGPQTTETPAPAVRYYEIDEETARKWILSAPPAFCNTQDKQVLRQVLNGYDQETADFYRWHIDYTQEELATLIARKWMASTGYMPDAFVVEGPKAGGHLGFSPEHIVDPNYALEQLVPQVVEAVKPLEDKAGRAIPVIAESSVASVKWRGGWVCRSTTSPFSHNNSSPFATTGSGVPSFSSSRSLLPNSVRQPASARKRALATNLPLAMSSSITHLRNTASGQNCIKY